MSIYPISISIPESKIVDSVPPKLKKYSTIIPGKLDTYIFSTEKEYYKEYQDSLFGYTQKKKGWDCLRHYEILANGCIPYFTDLSNCPQRILHSFPKKLILQAMESSTPEIYLQDLLDYTREYLTCRAVAQSIFDRMGHSTPNRVLFIIQFPEPDYIRCLTLIGCKQILGIRCEETDIVGHIYDDYSIPTEYFYGNGFSYTKILPANLKILAENIEEQIKNHEYDIIIYGSAHRGGLPHWDIVTQYYRSDEIAVLCGEDYHTANKCVPADIATKCSLFVRELNSDFVDMDTRTDTILERLWRIEPNPI